MSKPILALNSIRGQSGKDTLIEQIEKQGLKVHRVAFADTLKQEMAYVLSPEDDIRCAKLEAEMHSPTKDVSRHSLSVYDIPRSKYRSWLLNQVAQHEWDIPRSLRWHLQQYGTEYIRGHLGKKSHWLDQGCNEIEAALQFLPVDLVVVTDMRLPNEYLRLDCMNARMVRIVRNWHNPNVDTQPYHQSDIALMAHRFDALVVNEWGKPEAMYDQIKEFL